MRLAILISHRLTLRKKIARAGANGQFESIRSPRHDFNLAQRALGAGSNWNVTDRVPVTNVACDLPADAHDLGYVVRQEGRATADP